ncbi:hypothetical protein [Domibacillus robiginosus]|uniref:hypothetical protein n=1 Tax=Domibacillus robiginosus TaxID=1071054 RepID=UPI000ACEA273|nr:hypothetical protein [Domibacillus robiginosus]
MDSMLKKKLAAGSLTAFLAIGALAGCGGAEEEETNTDTEEMETEEEEETEEETN